MVINCDKSAIIATLLLSALKEIPIKYFHSESSQKFIDLKLKFINFSTNGDVVKNGMAATFYFLILFI